MFIALGTALITALTMTLVLRARMSSLNGRSARKILRNSAPGMKESSDTKTTKPSMRLKTSPRYE